jgi:hypothetical protein
MHPKKARRGVAFGAAGFSCVDAGNVAALTFGSNRKPLTANLPRDWRLTDAEPFVSVLVRDHGIDRRENRFWTINTVQKSRIFDRALDEKRRALIGGQPTELGYAGL